MNTSERLVWGEPGMQKMAGGEGAPLMTGDRGSEAPGVGDAPLGAQWTQALALSTCSVNGETNFKGEEKGNNMYSLETYTYPCVYLRSI